jgi:hypothetical protein
MFKTVDKEIEDIQKARRLHVKGLESALTKAASVF